MDSVDVDASATPNTELLFMKFRRFIMAVFLPAIRCRLVRIRPGDLTPGEEMTGGNDCLGVKAYDVG